MQSENHEKVEVEPFEIIYNARASKTTAQSRKASMNSVNLMDKVTKDSKFKKLRKMTFNEEVIREIDVMDFDYFHKDIHSENG